MVRECWLGMEAGMPDPTPSETPSNESPAPSVSGPPSAAKPVPPVLPDLHRAGGKAGATAIDLLSDVSLQVRVELGRTRMLVEDVLRLNPDSVVELDKAAGDPVDVYVNGRHIARGEVLVLNEAFCVRVSEIIEPFQASEPPEAGAGPTATLRMSVPKGEVA
jgi:flagellar motor switch protein FliN/FliY